MAETIVDCTEMKLFMSLLQSEDDWTCDVSVGRLLAVTSMRNSPMEVDDYPISVTNSVIAEGEGAESGYF
jgi:hypothetical protein